MVFLGIGTGTTGAGDQKCKWWGNRAENKFDNNFHLRDRRMDRQTDKWTWDDSNDRAYV